MNEESKSVVLERYEIDYQETSKLFAKLSNLHARKVIIDALF